MTGSIFLLNPPSLPGSVANREGSAGMGALDANSKDAVLLLELPAGLGIYTAQLSGVGETTGIGLVEIYEAP